MGLFFMGVFCGCMLVLLCKKIWKWLSIRMLPAQYLQEYTVRRRYDAGLEKEIDRGE